MIVVSCSKIYSKVTYVEVLCFYIQGFPFPKSILRMAVSLKIAFSKKNFVNGTPCIWIISLWETWLMIIQICFLSFSYLWKSQTFPLYTGLLRSIFASLEYSSLIYYLLIRFFIHNFFLLFSILSISSSIYFVFVLSKTNKLTCLLSWTYWISYLVS